MIRGWLAYHLAGKSDVTLGRCNKESLWQKAAAQLLNVLLVVNWENGSMESNVVKGKIIQTDIQIVFWNQLLHLHQRYTCHECVTGNKGKPAPGKQDSSDGHWLKDSPPSFPNLP